VRRKEIRPERSARGLEEVASVRVIPRISTTGGTESRAPEDSRRVLETTASWGVGDSKETTCPTCLRVISIIPAPTSTITRRRAVAKGFFSLGSEARIGIPQ
jgi:hypothetical protein